MYLFKDRPIAGHLTAVFIVAILMRCLAVVMVPKFPDDDILYILASMSILTDQGYGYWLELPGTGYFWKTWVMPLYSYLQAFMMQLNGVDVFMTRLMTIGLFIVLGAVVCLVVYKMARLLGANERLSLAAAWILALSPSQCLWSTRLHPHPLLSFWLALFILMALIEVRSRGLGLALLCGSILGLATLTRGEAASLGVPIFAWWIIREKNWRTAERMGVFVVGFFLVMSPWIIRNWRLNHRFMVTATNYEENWLFAHNPSYVPGDPFANVDWNKFLSPEVHAELKTLRTEREAADVYYREAMKYVREHPGKFIYTTAFHFWHFWRPWLTGRWVPWYFNLLYISTSLPFLIFFFIGTARLRSLKSGWFLLSSFVIWKSLTHLPFYIVIRFRENVFPFIMLVALFGFVVTCRKAAEKWGLQIDPKALQE